MGVIESLSLQKHCKKVCNSKQIWNNESKNGQKRNILMTGEEEEDDGRKRKKKKKRWKQTRGEIHKVKIWMNFISDQCIDATLLWPRCERGLGSSATPPDFRSEPHLASAALYCWQLLSDQLNVCTSQQDDGAESLWSASINHINHEWVINEELCVVL